MSLILLKNQEYFPALVAVIDEAETEIIMSFFLFKTKMNQNSYPDKIFAHLVRAAKRGVKVLILLENSDGFDSNLNAENKRTKNILEDKGIKVYFDTPQKITHTKLVVIDQKIILLGSHNLTQSALKYNNEVSIFIENPELAREARTYMLKLIRGAK
ncbi:MAG: phospholipase D-like domain-containing protein [Smithella sp.]